MDDVRESIDMFGHTGTIENILIGIAYWLAVVVVILFVFYIVVKINNWRQYKKNGKLEKEDFLT
ncbi:MAG: hypothetical protein IKS48_04440 [Eubacterium sp.]|nr:hypothetical protein [Eubacterium sp.]MBR6402611.1 hypothetical protein [Eubacterium sp.]